MMCCVLYPQWGHKPCHLAAWKGHEDSVRLLIDRGANIEAADNVRTQWQATPSAMAPRREQ